MNRTNKINLKTALVQEPDTDDNLIMVPSCTGMSVQRAALTVVRTWMKFGGLFGTPEAGWKEELKQKEVLVPEVRPNKRGYGVKFTYHEMHIETNLKIENVVRVTFGYATREQKARRTPKSKFVP